MSDVRIGTSGWNYPSGKGTWNGIFYPPAGRRPKGFDELAFYTQHFKKEKKKKKKKKKTKKKKK